VTSSIDGLVSGLGTSNLIQQLMTVEAAPQSRLKSKVSTAQTAAASYQSVNSQIAALKRAGDTLGQLGTWRSISATSSSPTVTATTSNNLNATTGSLTFNVKSLASKQFTTMKVTTLVANDADGKVDDPYPLTGNSSVSITKGSYDENGTFTASGAPVSIDISADQSAAGIAKAINAANLGLSAYVMKTGDAEGVLQITSTATGAANGFQIDGLDGTGMNGDSPASSFAKDAKLELSGGGGSTYEVKSNTNTFSGLMAGVTLTVSKEEDNVTVDVASDVGGIADKIQTMVDAANAALSEIGSQTAYDPATKKGSPLTGDFAVRNMTQRILSAVSAGLDWSTEAADGEDVSTKIKSLKELGIQLGQSGELRFERKDFMKAFADDPARAREAGMKFGEGIRSMSDNMTVNLKSIITGRNNEITSLNSQISNWDVRLAAKRLALQKQYSDLETALGKLKNQSNWLAGQLSGMS
jgi:flagellar hook-associated protein 2